MAGQREVLVLPDSVERGRQCRMPVPKSYCVFTVQFSNEISICVYINNMYNNINILHIFVNQKAISDIIETAGEIEELYTYYGQSWPYASSLNP